jgi:4-amino-4-deoxy-L-arabinose transferase-like glycosyltransferase
MVKASPTLQRFNQPILFLLVFGCLLFFFRLGDPGLMDPDEGRYAEIAREMLVLGDFVTPHLNFLPYLEKPPLVYWLTAFSLSLGGLNELAARAIPAISALGGLLAVFWFSHKLWGPQTAFLAAMVLATSSGYFILGRLLTLDMTLTGFMTWGIVLAYLAVRNQRPHYLPWAYLALGLAVLTKGPVGVVLPGLIFLTWFLVQKQWWGVFRLWHSGGVLLFAAIVLPWYMLVAWRHPDFWQYFFLREHLQRFLAPYIHAGQPFYYYFGVLVASLLPWIFLLPWAWQTSRSGPPPSAGARDRLFLLLWFGVIFVFFSLARSKLFPYLLPGLPPLAILVAWALSAAGTSANLEGSVWRWTLRVWLILALMSFTALVLTAGFFPDLWRHIAFVSPYPLVYTLILTILPLCLLAGLPSWASRGHLLLAGAVLLNMVLLFGVERVAEIRSPKPLAQVINSRWRADSIIVGFQHYSQSISFYTGQPFYLSEVRGELAFGMQQRPENPYYLGPVTQLTELLRQHPDFFLLIDNDNLASLQINYTEPVTILTQWKNYLLIAKP